MLFNEIVYGPIHSRRLGRSLGINLMPTTDKLCTFNCVYCECGFNTKVDHPRLPTKEEFASALQARLDSLSESSETIDVITFSGNGEPTLHPDFLPIIRLTCRLRDTYFPKAKVSVLTNSTQLFRDDVIEALRLVDNRILKLDSAINSTMHLIDDPVNTSLTVETIEKLLARFEGDFILQTCFLRGTKGADIIDNTTPEEIKAWYEAVDRLRPKQIMMYVIDRATPLKTLEKISAEQMNAIAQPLRDKGYDVILSC